jgi:hypothetical protein
MLSNTQRQWKRYRSKRFRTRRADGLSNGEAGANPCDSSGTAWHRIFQGARETYCCTGCRRGAARAKGPAWRSFLALRPACFPLRPSWPNSTTGQAPASGDGRQHPRARAGHLTSQTMRMEKMVNLLIDFRLSIRSTMQASARNPERQAPARAG